MRGLWEAHGEAILRPMRGGWTRPLLTRAQRDESREMRNRLNDDERAEIEAEIEALRQEHRDLDSAIEALQSVGAPDQLQLQRLKKRKLVLRDRVAQLEDMLTPDIIA